MDLILLLSFGAALVATAILAVFWAAVRNAAGHRRARAQHALACGNQLVALVAQVQQHRGMSGAWLAGDASFGTRLPQKQAEVERLFEVLERAVAKEEAERLPCFSRRDVEGLRRQWRALVTSLPGKTGEESFQSHCAVVGVLLEWLGSLGEARIEQPLAGSIPAAPVRNFAHRLPVLAECLGQGRALSSAVAAKGHCPPVSRVRLMFFVSRAESLLDQALASEGASTSDRAEAKRAVSAFVSAVRGRLLSSRAVEISAGDCFQLGTRAVDGVFAWLEAERSTLETALAGSRTGAVGAAS